MFDNIFGRRESVTVGEEKGRVSLTDGEGHSLDWVESKGDMNVSGLGAGGQKISSGKSSDRR